MKKESVFFTADNVALKNFKGVKDFKGRLNGNCCLVIGSEATGKTNLIQAIYMILKKYPSAVLTQGEEEGSASIEISKGDVKYLFKFSFEEGDDEPKMKTIVDGERITIAKQTDIIKKLTPVMFDMDDLINSTGQKQADLILKAFDIDVSKEKEEYKEAFDERRVARRSLEEASHFEVKEEAKGIDTKELQEKLKKATEKRQLIDKAEMKKETLQEKQIELKKEMETLKKKMNETEEALKKGEGFIKEQFDLVEKNPASYDVGKIEERLASAEVINTEAREYEEYLKKLEIKKKKKAEADKWEKKVKEAAKSILEKINSKEIPVPDLNINTSISETSGRISSELTYKDLPFDDESINTAERVAIGAKLQISLFKEGNLGIISLNAGSVGNNTIKSISEECGKQGLQVLWELTSKDDDKTLELETVLKK